MMINHKWRASGFIWALAMIMAVLLPPAFAAAEDAQAILEISVVANPVELVEPGEVMLNFTIENPSDTDAQNVYLSSADGLLSEPVGRVAAGERQSFNRQHSVSADELNAGEINYTISHDDPQNPDGKVNYTVHAEIHRSDMQPQVEFTRQFSSRYVEAGGTLTVSYRLRNTGNIALSNLRVQDVLGDYTGRIDRLEVGESRTLISRVVITEEALSSAALDYACDSSEETFTQALDEAPIYIAETSLDILFSANASAFSDDSAQAVLTLTNNGNTDISNVCITDEIYGGVVADSLTIPAGGEAVEVARSYPRRGEMQFQWKISGKSASGAPVNMMTTTQTLAAADEKNPFSELYLETMTLTPRIRKSGNVSVFVRIDNPSDSDVWNVCLREETLGEVYNFEVIPGGDSVSREFSFHVSDDTAYAFSISYSDAQGNQRSYSAALLEFVIASDGVLPEGASDSLIEFTGKSIKIGGSSTFAVLLLSGCAVLLVLIVLLVIASRRARFERRVRIAAAKQRRKAGNGKSNARAAKNKTKGR